MLMNVYLAAPVRTPIGGLMGGLSSIAAPQLAGRVIAESCRRAGVRPDQLDEVIVGNVLSAGLGQNVARQSAIAAGAPPQVGGTTVNKVCGSGLKAVMLAAQAIQAGDAQLIAAGGTENMSQAPYLLPKARAGYRMGHGELIDSLLHDGLWDVYNNLHMGVCGDRTAQRCNLSRQQQDDFAVASYQRAQQAQQAGAFASEILPVVIADRKGETRVEQDEEPQRFNEAKLRQLRPAFDPAGSTTAGNASSINDGAAAMLVCSEQMLSACNLKPLARVVGFAAAAREPEWFTLAPIDAMQKLLARVGWSVTDVDLWEINEAFSVVPMAAMQEMKLPHQQVNVHGGAVALGHPIGASGARVLVTLLHALTRQSAKRGIASLCIGGGEGVALAVEMC